MSGQGNLPLAHPAARLRAVNALSLEGKARALPSLGYAASARLAIRHVHGEDGAALVEFAMCLPVLALVFGCIVSYGIMLQQAMEVTHAATAGAAYGAVWGNQSNLTGMQTAAQNAAPDLSGLTVSATNVFACSAGGASVSSSTTCTGYGTPIEYVRIQTSTTVHPLLPFLGLPYNFTLTGTAAFRVPYAP